MPQNVKPVGRVAATATAHAVLITCALDGLAHLVSDDALAAGLTASTGSTRRGAAAKSRLRRWSLHPAPGVHGASCGPLAAPLARRGIAAAAGGVDGSGPLRLRRGRG